MTKLIKSCPVLVASVAVCFSMQALASLFKKAQGV